VLYLANAAADATGFITMSTHPLPGP